MKTKHIARLFEQAENESESERGAKDTYTPRSAQQVFGLGCTTATSQGNRKRIQRTEFAGMLLLAFTIGACVFFLVAARGCEPTKIPAPAATGNGQNVNNKH